MSTCSRSDAQGKVVEKMHGWFAEEVSDEWNGTGRQGHLAEGVPGHAHADGPARLGLAGEEVHALLGHRLACVQDQRVLQHHISTIQSGTKQSYNNACQCMSGLMPEANAASS